MIKKKNSEKADKVKHIIYASFSEFSPLKNYLLMKAIFIPLFNLTNLNKELEKLVKNFSIYDFLTSPYDNFWHF